MKQAKLQWLQNPSVVNEDNLHNVRREASRHFRNKKREYLKEKNTEIELNIRIRSETCIGLQLNLRRVTNLKLTW
jgi:hypothetical protein